MKGYSLPHQIPAEPCPGQPVLCPRHDCPLHRRAARRQRLPPPADCRHRHRPVLRRRRLNPGPAAGGRRPVSGRHRPAPLPQRRREDALPTALRDLLGAGPLGGRGGGGGRGRSGGGRRGGRLILHGHSPILPRLPLPLPRSHLHLLARPLRRPLQLCPHQEELCRLRHPRQLQRGHQQLRELTQQRQ